MSQIKDLHWGSDEDITIHRPPDISKLRITKSYYDVLHGNGVLAGDGGPYNSFFEHRITKNVLKNCESGILFGDDNILKFFESFPIPERVSSIYTESMITNVNMNRQNTFGAVQTENGVQIFTMSDGRFKKTVKLNVSDVADSSVSEYINGQSVVISKNGSVTLFFGDRKISTIENRSAHSASICYGRSPTMVLGSLGTHVAMFDTRVKMEVGAIQEKRICTMTMGRDFIVGMGRNNGCLLYDLRFPSDPLHFFRYPFGTNNISIYPKQLGEYDSFAVMSSLPAEIVYFPFKDNEFCLPVMPCIPTAAQYHEMEDNSLIGYMDRGERQLVCFESGLIMEYKLKKDSPITRQILISFDRRSRDQAMEDINLPLSCEEYPSPGNDDTEIDVSQWMKNVPKGFLKDPLPPPELDPIDTYLSQEDLALEFDKSTLNEALPMMWNFHINQCRQNH